MNDTNDKSVSCVICAYNEAERIGDVLKIAVAHHAVAEVVVVDDGSTDGTADVVTSFPNVRLIRLPHNGGKSRAFARGVQESSGELIMCLDADIRDLTKENVSALIEPVASRIADISISLRGNSLLICRLIGLDYLSGERVMPKAFITPHIGAIVALSPYGIESFLNRRMIEQKLRLAIVRLDNVKNMTKRAKIGWWSGVVAQWRMVLDILQVISLPEVARQNYMMLKLSRVHEASVASKADQDNSMSREAFLYRVPMRLIRKHVIPYIATKTDE